jgi:hypothetical protein
LTVDLPPLERPRLRGISGRRLVSTFTST